MAELAPVAILAGGRGTRLGDATESVPKALVEVAGEPFLFHQLRLLRRSGARRVVICVGYRGDQIVAAVGNGASFELEVAYSYDGDELIGTAAALRQAAPQLGGLFHVLYGDTYLRVDCAAVESAFRATDLPALMTVFRNRNSLGASNVVYSEGRVVTYDKENPTADMEWIDYGLAVLSPPALERPGADLATVYRDLAREGLLAGYEVAARFYDIGDPSARQETDEFLRSSSESTSGARSS